MTRNRNRIRICFLNFEMLVLLTQLKCLYCAILMADEVIQCVKFYCLYTTWFYFIVDMKSKEKKNHKRGSVEAFLPSFLSLFPTNLPVIAVLFIHIKARYDAQRRLLHSAISNIFAFGITKI